jgi:hypothetical protein
VPGPVRGSALSHPQDAKEIAMNRSSLALTTLLATLVLGATSSASDDKKSMKDMAKMAPMSDQQVTRSAMSAAPAKVAAKASIVAMKPDGSMRTVRAGNNGFTCMADNPVTPGPDPMCMDAAAWDWAHAWIGKKPPTAGRVGLMYMLAGGTDASNTDPYAQKPAPNNHWVKTGPHVMIVGASAEFYAMYPKSADPDTSVPYVMWAGTPYQHLMIPVH